MPHYKFERPELVDSIYENILDALNRSGGTISGIVESEIKGNLGVLVELSRKWTLED